MRTKKNVNHFIRRFLDVAIEGFMHILLPPFNIMMIMNNEKKTNCEAVVKLTMNCSFRQRTN